MPIKQTFIINYQSDSKPISFFEWLATRPEEEQSSYHQARTRMDAYRQEAIDNGLMTLDTDGYIWRDEQARQQGKRQDDECLNFYDRYNKDVGITVTWTWTEI